MMNELELVIIKKEFINSDCRYLYEFIRKNNLIDRLTIMDTSKLYFNIEREKRFTPPCMETTISMVLELYSKSFLEYNYTVHESSYIYTIAVFKNYNYADAKAIFIDNPEIKTALLIDLVT